MLLFLEMKKDILVFDERPMDGLDNTTLNAEAKCSINISKSKKKVCISQSVFHILMVWKFINLKEKA